jgi:hypothetical protein
MAKKARSRVTKPSPSGKVVQLNPWLPAVPIKGKTALKLILGIPLAILASDVSAEPLPNRTLAVPLELSRHTLSVRDFDREVLPAKYRLLQQYEDKTVFLVARRKK